MLHVLEAVVIPCNWAVRVEHGWTFLIPRPSRNNKTMHEFYLLRPVPVDQNRTDSSFRYRSGWGTGETCRRLYSPRQFAVQCSIYAPKSTISWLPAPAFTPQATALHSTYLLRIPHRHTMKHLKHLLTADMSIFHRTRYQPIRSRAMHGSNTSQTTANSNTVPCTQSLARQVCRLRLCAWTAWSHRFLNHRNQHQHMPVYDGVHRKTCGSVFLCLFVLSRRYTEHKSDATHASWTLPGHWTTRRPTVLHDGHPALERLVLVRLSRRYTKLAARSVVCSTLAKQKIIKLTDSRQQSKNGNYLWSVEKAE